MNPLVPTALDGVLMTVSVVALITALTAVISLLRSASRTGLPLLAWVLVVLLVPFVGPGAWFAARRLGGSSGPDEAGGDDRLAGSA